MSSLILYSYYRSSCAYRVRIALNLKGLDYEYRPVHLVRDGGEQYKEDYLKFNPMGQVPCLIHDDKVLTQSLAILQYLDEVFPKPAIFPPDPFGKAKVLQLCETINAGIQPLQNLSVLRHLDGTFEAGDKGKFDWAHYWIARGFNAFEAMLRETAGTYCLGNEVTAADALLVPQIYNANRFKVDLDAYPTIQRVWAACRELQAFIDAEPENQIDAPK